MADLQRSRTPGLTACMAAFRLSAGVGDMRAVLQSEVGQRAEEDQPWLNEAMQVSSTQQDFLNESSTVMGSRCMLCLPSAITR
ncbi:MAG: hypothetical protein GTN84_16970 [Hydrogenophaga sp.]|uniref:hypothetical protein n=1 Tax=Hydrogenophaga sp. TaxID=1904254 RepID=UPI0016996BBF|nr:hypothetical protein [Hydrogenophaga sp.]NIM42273.1 hypothetical protein [Hydrogenophaga sp.]NIN28005.1 hypothetical protein [Hydrogenophaga sp.]NIN32783.1 hypothetical protein [Hydrogenophaga sp.]NIN54672.1 hypothetical protein [Hydrogenophaga sp.]NIO51348.1 hypothetical protein [Hydrogenophaga sp.]